MRTLKSSERRLVAIFAGMIFILANLMVLEQITQKKDVLQSELRKLRLEKSEAGFWLAQRDLWLQRKTWLDEKQPRLGGAGQESATLLESLQQSSKEQKISLGERKIAEPSTNLFYTQIAVQIKTKAPMENLVYWLASLQQPEAFQAITNLTLKKDPETSSMACDLTVSRWYHLP